MKVLFKGEIIVDDLGDLVASDTQCSDGAKVE